ncbi:helix-turn-helix domain-containing protein [Thermodesulfobacteriota bacterium]
MDRMLTVKEIAETMGVQTQTIYTWNRLGKDLPPLRKVNRRWYVLQSEFEQWMEKIGEHKTKMGVTSNEET